MTRNERVSTNPNHCVGNHPLINSDHISQYYPDPGDSRPVFRSAFNEASFHKDVIEWKPSPFSRRSLEVAIRQISKVDLPDGENVIVYL